MQPDDQQSPATESTPASAEAADTTVPAEARPVPEIVPDAPAHGDSSQPAETPAVPSPAAMKKASPAAVRPATCSLYTSDPADEPPLVDSGGLLFIQNI
ncbi:hypothetical protein NGH33_01570, partial [Micrococcus yunnanensis]|nr:hypothetical protein [Micrococcus yunnanensis]